MVIISVHGVVNNCILLAIVFKLRWHRCIHYTFLINQILVDLCTATTNATVSTVLLIHHMTGTSTRITQLQCVSLYIPQSIFITYGQRSSLMIAIDRLINVLYPHMWLRLGIRYRASMICAALIWVLIQELGWLVFAEPTVSIDVCYAYASYPDCWWSKVVTIGDTTASCLIIVAYVILPPLSGTIFRKLNTRRHFQVALADMEHKQRLTVKRVRKLSFLTILSFIVTTFIGFAVCDITEVYVQNEMLLLFVQICGDSLSTVNTVLPLYLFAWRMNVFRSKK